MGSQWIIGALAFVTIGLLIAISVYHFGTFLKDPRNRRSLANVAAGGKSASTKVQEQAPGPGLDTSKPVKQRLDESIASAHPDDPDIKGHR